MLFRGYRVGSVETSTFDPQKRTISYQLFINAPNDRLVTSNVRFWKDSGIAVDLTSAGMRVEMGSLTTLFGGGVSFDVPEGQDLGQPVAEKTAFRLFDDQRSIQDALYTDHIDFLMFLKIPSVAFSRARLLNSAAFAWVRWGKFRSLYRVCSRYWMTITAFRC